MTTKEFKRIARILKEVYKKVEEEALANGINPLSSDYDKILELARLRVLEEAGYTLEEYREAKAKVAGYSQSDYLENVEESKDELSKIQERLENLEARYVPNDEDIEKISERVSKKYIKEPQIINKIVDRVTIKEPKVVKETIKVKERVEYDDTNLKKTLKNLDEKVEKQKELVTGELKSFFEDNFSINFKHNIDTLGMPDFRKLAMGLQGQIDEIRSNGSSGSGTVGPGTINEIAYFDTANTVTSLTVATYPSLTELSYVKGVTSAIQTQINTKAPSTSPTFATSITGSYLTASEMLITDGSKNIVSAPVATYPSLTELTYLKGATSAIQTQIDGKIDGTMVSTRIPIGSDSNTLTTDADLTYDATNNVLNVGGITMGKYGGEKGFEVTTGQDIYFVTGGDYMRFQTVNSSLDLATSGGGAYTSFGVNYGGYTGNINVGNGGAFMDIVPIATLSTRIGANGTTGYLQINTSGLIQLHGTTSSYPALKRSSAILQARLADDSAYTDIEVADEAYDSTAWNGSLEVPTKNAIRDKIESMSTGSGLTWNEETTTAATMAVNNGYIANNAALVTLTLPTTATVGSIVRVAGKGAGGWRIAQNASEIIHFGNVDTTTGTGGRLDSTDINDAVELLCIVADTEWMVLSSQGNITIT